jgi:SHS2 domain-containing protein
MSLRDVKAPTYSEMQTEFEDGNWQLSAVLDL